VRGLGVLLLLVGFTLMFLTYTKSTGQVIGAIINAPASKGAASAAKP
jgi:hypothetical protein